MKKPLFVVLATFLATNWSYANEDKVVNVNQLPSEAKNFIAVYFSESQIEEVVVESRTNDYEVTTTDGIAFDFDKSGNWKAVDCDTESVPSTLIPREVSNKVAKVYGPNSKITLLSRTKKGYRVELSNGVEIGFNKKFKIIPLVH